MLFCAKTLVGPVRAAKRLWASQILVKLSVKKLANVKERSHNMTRRTERLEGNSSLRRSASHATHLCPT